MELLKKKSTRIALQIIILALVTVSIGLMVYTMFYYRNTFAKNTGYSLSYALIIFALLSAALYATLGFRKNARVFYYVFMGFVLVVQLCSLYFIYKQLSPIHIVICLVAFGATSVLTFAMDLGLLKSLILCGVMVVSAINGFIITVVKRGGVYLPYLYPTIAYCVLALFIFLVILAKYADKAERGTK